MIAPALKYSLLTVRQGPSRSGRVRCLASAEPKSQPRVVVFDLGKVLLDFCYHKSSFRLAAACQAPNPTRPEVLLELFGHAPPGQATGLLDRWGGRSLVEQVERGQLSNQQFYEAVVEASGLQVDFPTFSQLYADIFSEEPPMIAAQQHLAQAGVPTYLMSNISGLHFEHAVRRHPFLSSFTGVILSYQVHSFKPEPEIYAAAESLTQLAGPDLLFIDDREENAAAAAQRGWHAIHHRSPQATLRALHELGLPTMGA